MVMDSDGRCSLLSLDERGSGALALLLFFALVLLALAHFGFFDLSGFLDSLREAISSVI